MLVFAGTGHRPPKLGGYSLEAENRLQNFAKLTLAKLRPDSIISGMAIGWDQAIAWGAVQLGIPFIAAVPFKGQESRWPRGSQEEYQFFLEQADEIVIVSQGGYSPNKMQVRNEWMVDHCTHVLALWDGSSGGTLNCIKYAGKVERVVMNVWKPWMDFTDDGETAPGNIFSGNRVLAALTNPTELARKKGTLDEGYPVRFRGRMFADAEAAYQITKQASDHMDFISLQILCSEVISAKLHQHPQLVDFIRTNGGVTWLEKCEHVVGARTDGFKQWEGKGTGSAFIRALIVAYESC